MSGIVSEVEGASHRTTTPSPHHPTSIHRWRPRQQQRTHASRVRPLYRCRIGQRYNATHTHTRAHTHTTCVHALRLPQWLEPLARAHARSHALLPRYSVQLINTRARTRAHTHNHNPAHTHRGTYGRRPCRVVLCLWRRYRVLRPRINPSKPKQTNIKIKQVKPLNGKPNKHQNNTKHTPQMVVDKSVFHQC